MSYSQLPDNGWTAVAAGGAGTANVFVQLGLIDSSYSSSASSSITELSIQIQFWDPSRAPEFATFNSVLSLDGYVVGTAGDDTVVTNPGNDWYQLGSGVDTLSYSSGFGHDIVDIVAGSGGSTDSFNLTTGIATDSLWGYRTGDQYAVANLAGSDNLTLLGLAPSTIGTFTAGAGSGSPDAFTAATDANANGIADFSELISVRYGTSYGDTITAADGVGAVIWGGAGSDTLTGGSQRTVLFGGGDGDQLTSKSAQYSTLVGGTGDDIYVLAAGTSAEIDDLDASLADVVSSSAILLNAPTTWVYTIEGRHLGIFDYATQTYLLIYDWQSAENKIETFNFGDGTYTYDAIAAGYQTAPNYLGDFTWEQLGGSTARADAWLANLRLLAGNDQGPTLNLTIGGTDSADTLTGFSGDNTLVGGKGNDTLTGGAGNDTYVFRPGDGQDTVDNFTNANAGEYNTLRFGGGVLAGQLSAKPGGDFLSVNALILSYSTGGTDQVQLTAWYDIMGGAYRTRILAIQTSDSPELWLTTPDTSNFGFSELMVGTSTGDTLSTGAGDDWIVGAGGNDAINGGTGTDTVAYAGSRASYSIVRDAGVVTVTDLNGASDGGDSGADTLRNIERLQFSDGAVSLVVPTNDFNGDGSSDLFWQSAGGALALWQQSGTRYTGGGVFSGPGSSWSMLGLADFNGDGSDDILWQNGSGALAEWQLNGTTYVGGGVFAGPGAGWTLAGLADFNGDGMADMLWQNGNSFAEWQMNGTAKIGGGSFAGPGGGWTLKALADFNGDGKADILWQTGNSLAEWQMDGTLYIGGGVFSGPGGSWALKGVSDFTGDGKADLLWQSGTSLAEWYLNGTAYAGGGVFSGAGGTWSIAGLSDFNGDGKTDILWSTPGGALAQWHMDGVSYVGGGVFGPQPSGWNLVNTGQLVA